MTQARSTDRPQSLAHRGALEALVYARQTCTVHPLPQSGMVRLGRGADNDIQVEEQSVSRHHLLIHLGGAAVEVEDLGSANGTLIFRIDPEEAGEAPTQRNEAEARLQSGERRILEPGGFVRAGAVLVMIQERQPIAAPPGGRPLNLPADEGPAVLLDPEMKRAYEIALRAAQSGISVLITGETGSGKEVFAETIHKRSHRRTRPFLRLNCAALTESLLESELFGHERGAFTGANQAKAGLLESTDQGTVFLDEIGEMPLSTQAKLLRVLEEGTILRVGSTKPRRIDVRFVWATNRDLRAAASAGRFRNDLYYRIAGVEFAIPPLRRRPSEIEPLARLFLRRFCEQSGLAVPELTQAALEALHRYSWPGNVRELKNVMERAPFLCEGGPITEQHVPTEPTLDLASDLYSADDFDATEVFAPVRTPTGQPPFPSARPTLAPALADESERQRILRALEQCAGNQTRAAKVLGMSRRTLINRLERMHLPRPKKL